MRFSEKIDGQPFRFDMECQNAIYLTTSKTTSYAKKNILKYNVIVIKVFGKTNRDSGSTCSKSIKMYFYLRGKESISTIQSATVLL